MQLTVPHWRQRQPGECLTACVAMVLTHLGENVAYEPLRQRLGTFSAGAFFFNVDRVRSWWLRVERGRGTLETLRQHLDAGRPIIIPVDTGLLPYWLTRPDVPLAERITDHAVVVVGIDEEFIYVNDPDFELAPQVVEIGWFHEAWRNFAGHYAVIHRRWPWR